MMEKFDLPDIVNGNRIKLVRREHKYDEQMWSIINNNREFLRQYLPWVDKQNSLNDVANSTDYFAKCWSEFEEQALLIVDKNTNELFGCIGIHKYDFTNYSGELGYWLKQDKTGLGYMSEAVKLVETEAFAPNRMHRMVIKCDTNNRASAGVAIRNGYKLEGILQDGLYYYDGTFHNEELYAKVKF